MTFEAKIKCQEKHETPKADLARLVTIKEAFVEINSLFLFEFTPGLAGFMMLNLYFCVVFVDHYFISALSSGHYIRIIWFSPIHGFGIPH